MPAPNNQFIAIVIDSSGKTIQGTSVYAYKVFAHIDMDVTYDVVID